MSEDHTQSPTKLRRQQARERGQVAHSPELTGAVGLLAAVAVLGACGDDLAAGLLNCVRAPLTGAPVLVADPVEVVARLRLLAFGVAWPLGAVLAGFAVAALVTHQVQVGGLWAPGLLAPDIARLWAIGQGTGFAARGGRGAWSLVKTVVVVLVAGGALRSGWTDFQKLGALDPPALACAAGRTLRHAALTLGGATLVLGLFDYYLQYQRYEEMLKTTPQEQREEFRSMEGDPVLRSRRRQLARSRRGVPAEALAGASLVLLGRSGLTLILAGGPPPRRISIRSVAEGVAGARLRRAAEQAGLAQAEAPDLARRIARRRAPALPLAPDLLNALALRWPAAPPPRAS